MENELRKNIKSIMIIVLLTAATLTVYWQVQYHDFINYDDPLYIENQIVRQGLSWEGISWAFQSTMVANWHPLTWISHMIDFDLFGKKPAGHHLTNIFFHLVNTLLLFLIFKEMTSNYWRSALVAALFALHPLHVESVAWVAERKDVLSTLFFILTIAFYIEYVKYQTKGFYIATIFIFILGLLAKPMLVTLPFILLLLDFWPLSRLHCSANTKANTYHTIRILLTEKIPFFICSIISCIITYNVQSSGGAVSQIKYLPISVRVSNAFISYAEYLNKTFWPRDMAIFYPYADTILLSKAVGAALIIIIITFAALYSLRKTPYFFVGWCWYLGTLVPVIGLVQVGIQALADRYTYIPLIGIFIICSWGLVDVTANVRYKNIVRSLCAILILINLSFTTWHQVSYWKNDVQLLEHALSVTLINPIAENNLGLALAKNGKQDEAMRHYQEVLRVNPYDAGALTNAGLILLGRGKQKEAINNFRIAIKHNPNSEAAHINLGAQLAATKNPIKRAEAILHLLEAIRINPLAYLPHYHLGMIFLNVNNSVAIMHFQEAVRLNPEYGRAHLQLGNLYLQKGIRNKAAYHFDKALQCDTDPELDVLHIAISDQLLLQGQLEEALNQMEIAVQLNPRSPENHHKYGHLLKRMGQIDKANHHFSEALRLDPNFKKTREAIVRPQNWTGE